MVEVENVMAVGFQVDFLWYQVGDGDFLHSFFSTICYRLENGRWGSKFPHLMNDLYQDGLEWTAVPFARKELKTVQKKLRKLPPSDVIWDMEDLSKQPPWKNDISREITDLSNYFVTSDGRDLITVLLMAFDDAEEIRHRIKIRSL